MNKLDKIDVLCMATSATINAVEAWRKAKAHNEQNFCQVSYPCEIIRAMWRELPRSLRKDLDVEMAMSRLFPHQSENENLIQLSKDLHVVHMWAHKKFRELDGFKNR